VLRFWCDGKDDNGRASLARRHGAGSRCSSVDLSCGCLDSTNSSGGSDGCECVRSIENGALAADNSPIRRAVKHTQSALKS
jgi:hypothetical protein